MKRRQFLALPAALALTGCTRMYFDGDLWNPCLPPAELDTESLRELLAAAWKGIDPKLFYDCHVHLIGTGDSDSGIYVNPDLASLWSPGQFAQRKFYQNAACVDEAELKDQAVVERLFAQLEAFPVGARGLLLAFDYYHDEEGQVDKAMSVFHVPNAYARRVAKAYPDRLHWIASIHPYREDAVEVLEQAVKDGARAVKWLPQAMGIDPSSPLCNPFYDAMARLDIPLLSHAGEEMAVKSEEAMDWGNPLLLRYALARGVRVIVAHCASLGEGTDFDDKAKPQVSNFSLFARMMDSKDYEGRLFGEISTLPQINRVGEPLQVVLSRRDWQSRLLNASDYPLPGVMPLVSAQQLIDMQFLSAEDAALIFPVRDHNPLLFDFLLKRSLRYQGQGFAEQVFETAAVFEKTV